MKCLSEITAKYGVDNRNIGLELTESLMLRDQNAAIEVLHELRSAGFHLSLDDFGTGFSSLSYVDHLPLNAFKIDRSFISRLGRDAGDHTLSLIHI